MELNLKKNRLEEADVAGLPNLRSLFLQKNPLSKKINFGERSAVTCLLIQNTKLEALTELPRTIEVLEADRKAILVLNFQELSSLKSLRIRNGSTTREELVNLDKEVKLENRR